jgi:hypothetical protein
VSRVSGMPGREGALGLGPRQESRVEDVVHFLAGHDGHGHPRVQGRMIHVGPALRPASCRAPDFAGGGPSGRGRGGDVSSERYPMQLFCALLGFFRSCASYYIAKMALKSATRSATATARQTAMAVAIPAVGTRSFAMLRHTQPFSAVRSACAQKAARSGATGRALSVRVAAVNGNGLPIDLRGKLADGRSIV